MKVLSCNIRYFGAEDGQHSWEHRKQLCADVIRSESPDIICFQEMCQQQFAYLTAALPGNQSYAMADLPTGQHPKNCIFFRDAAHTLISAGGYWLSETPHVAGSKSWQSAHVRLANWVRLKDHATGTEFRVVNTHLDNKGQAAREHQARVIVEDARAYPEDYPQILTGDMNCDCTSAAIDVFKAGGWSDTYSAMHGTENPGPTFHAFRGPAHDAAVGKIDWIFARGRANPMAAAVMTHSEAGRFPSDHYFVSADIRIEKSV